MHRTDVTRDSDWAKVSLLLVRNWRWQSNDGESYWNRQHLLQRAETIAPLLQLWWRGFEVESHENGKFAWIMHPEGNKVELWAPMIWEEKTRAPEDLGQAVNHSMSFVAYTNRYEVASSRTSRAHPQESVKPAPP